MDLPPLNEWIADELTRTRDALSDLAERHENILNHLADVCRRNDKMQVSGDRMRDLLNLLWVFPNPEADVEATEVEKAIADWGNANV